MKLNMAKWNILKSYYFRQLLKEKKPDVNDCKFKTALKHFNELQKRENEYLKKKTDSDWKCKFILGIDL